MEFEDDGARKRGRVGTWKWLGKQETCKWSNSFMMLKMHTLASPSCNVFSLVCFVAHIIVNFVGIVFCLVSVKYLFKVIRRFQAETQTNLKKTCIKLNLLVIINCSVYNSRMVIKLRTMKIFSIFGLDQTMIDLVSVPD